MYLLENRKIDQLSIGQRMSASVGWDVCMCHMHEYCRMVVCITKVITGTNCMNGTYMSIPWMSVTPANIPFRLDLEPPQQVRRELSSCQRLRVWFISLRIPSSSYNIQQISQYLCTHSMDFFITNWSATLHSNQWVRSPCIEKQAKNPPFHLTLGAYVPLENFCK